MNCNINSSGLYDVNSYNLIATNATVLSTLNVAGNIIGSGTALSNLNYGSITNPPDLTVSRSHGPRIRRRWTQRFDSLISMDHLARKSDPRARASTGRHQRQGVNARVNLGA
jgi:hypothetical protein